MSAYSLVIRATRGLLPYDYVHYFGVDAVDCRLGAV